MRDYLGAFAVTAGLGIEKKVAEFEAKKDDYNAIMLKALADRLAEAFAEWLHAKGAPRALGLRAGRSARQHGADPRGVSRHPSGARAIPHVPDHAVKAPLFALLRADAIGMTLTENFAMLPTAAVSGFYFSHPDSQYFAVGQDRRRPARRLRAARRHQARGSAAKACAEPWVRYACPNRAGSVVRLRNLRALVAAAALVGVAGPSGAVSMLFSHPLREFVDRRNVTISVYSDTVAIDCSVPVAVTQADKSITLTVRQAAPPPPNPPQCFAGVMAVLSPLPAGDYEVTAQVKSAAGLTVESATQPLQILPLEGRCNADPLISPSLLALHNTLSAAQLAHRLATDRAYAASLGNPTVLNTTGTLENRTYAQIVYPPLVDVTVEFDRLLASGQFADVWRNGYACLSAAPPDQIAQFVEFFNAGLDHYFYTGDASEIAAIEAGKVGPGWSRTGKSFRAVTAPGCIESSGKTLVYRFFGIPGVGPNSHFFTRDRAECYVVNKSGQWSFEGLPFWASAPLPDGTCAAKYFEAQVPLYRVWRPFGDSNHRFTTDRAVVTEMESKGWIDEGPAICVLPSV